MCCVKDSVYTNILQDKTLFCAFEACNIVCWLVNPPIAKLDLFKSLDCCWICKTYAEYCCRNSATVRRLVQSPTLQSTIFCGVHSDLRGKGIRVSPAWLCPTIKEPFLGLQNFRTTERLPLRELHYILCFTFISYFVFNRLKYQDCFRDNDRKLHYILCFTFVSYFVFNYLKYQDCARDQWQQEEQEHQIWSDPHRGSLDLGRHLLHNNNSWWVSQSVCLFVVINYSMQTFSHLESRLDIPALC